MIEPAPAKPLPLATGRQWAFSLVALLIIGLGTVGLRLWSDAARTEHVSVRIEYDSALTDAEKWATALESGLRNGDNLVRVSELVAESATGYIGEDDVDSLQTSVSTFNEVIAESREKASWVPRHHEPLADTAILWVVLGESAALRETTTELRGDSERLHTATTTMADESDEFEKSIVSVINTVGVTGETHLSRYTSATNTSYRDLKTAIEVATTQSSIDARTAGIVDRVVEATDAVAASHTAKENAKAGPLGTTRNEVEKFARSIAGGVRLDFTWKDIVIGHGQGRSAAGTATWDTADTGYSSITLTNSIARYWTSWAGYRALVAHEVGHAITSKCHELFSDPLFKSDNERWATAWAIGMGYTTSAANGAELYGHPSTAQINATKKCR